MRNRINIDTKEKNTFILKFQHENPEVAKRVASRLGSFFVEENIRAANRPPRKPRSFSWMRCRRPGKELEAQEEKLKQYKLQFGGELPQQSRQT